MKDQTETQEKTQYNWNCWFTHDGSRASRLTIDKMLAAVVKAMNDTLNGDEIHAYGLDYDNEEPWDEDEE